MIDEEGLAKFLESIGEEYVKNSKRQPNEDLEIALSIRNFCDTLASWARDGTLEQSSELYKNV